MSDPSEPRKTGYLGGGGGEGRKAREGNESGEMHGEYHFWENLWKEKMEILKVGQKNPFGVPCLHFCGLFELAWKNFFPMIWERHIWFYHPALMRRRRKQHHSDFPAVRLEREWQRCRGYLAAPLLGVFLPKGRVVQIVRAIFVLYLLFPKSGLTLQKKGTLGESHSIVVSISLV